MVSGEIQSGNADSTALATQPSAVSFVLHIIMATVQAPFPVCFGGFVIKFCKNIITCSKETIIREKQPEVKHGIHYILLKEHFFP